VFKQTEIIRFMKQSVRIRFVYFGCAVRRQTDCSYWSYRTWNDLRCWSM